MIRRIAIFRRAIIMTAAAGAFAVSGYRAAAGTWTNTVGDTIEADVLEFDGRTIEFLKTTGEKIRMPLFSLAKEEQHRIKEQFEGPAVPAALQAAYALAVGQLARARLLFTDGQMSDADYAARRDEVLSAFKRICEERSYAEDRNEVQQLVDRLLAL